MGYLLMKPSLVFVANHVPIPWVTGIAFQEWDDLRLLAKTHQVTLLALDNGDLASPEAEAAVDSLRELCHDVIIFPRPRSPKLISALRRGRAILEGMPATMAHNVRADCRRCLTALIATQPSTDIFLSDFFVAGILTGLHRRARVVVRLHSLDSDFAREVVQVETHPARKLSALVDLALISAAQHRLFRGLRQHDCILTCRDSERKVIGMRYRPAARVDCLPLCPPTHANHQRSAGGRSGEPVVVFTGLLDNPFNAVGIKWFVDVVWPTIRERVPDARLLIAGRRPTATVFALGAYPGVTVIGSPRDMHEVLDQATVAIAPIFFGSGVKQKCLEAFSFGLPLVTTTQGAEGLAARAGRDYLLADSAQEYATSVVSLLRDQSLRERLAANAAEYLERVHGERVRGEILARALGRD
jgi:glycosyltransferase involved in cell wall biosynthesis